MISKALQGLSVPDKQPSMTSHYNPNRNRGRESDPSLNCGRNPRDELVMSIPRTDPSTKVEATLTLATLTLATLATLAPALTLTRMDITPTLTPTLILIVILTPTLTLTTT